MRNFQVLFDEFVSVVEKGTKRDGLFPVDVDPEKVKNFRFASDTTLAVDLREGGTVLFDVATGSMIGTLTDSARNLVISNDVVFSSDGTLAVSDSFIGDGDVRTVLLLWDVVAGVVVSDISLDFVRLGNYSLAFSPENDGLFVGFDNGELSKYSLDGKEVWTKCVHSSSIKCLAVRRGSDVVVSASDDGTAKLLYSETGDVVTTFYGHASNIVWVDFVDDLTLATAGGDRTVRTWGVDGVETGPPMCLSRPVSPFFFVKSPTEDELCRLTETKDVRVYDLGSRTCRNVGNLYSSFPNCFSLKVRFSPDFRSAAVLSTPGPVFKLVVGLSDGETS